MLHKELAMVLCDTSAVGILDDGVTRKHEQPWEQPMEPCPRGSSGSGGTYTSCVAPQPTALEAEISPSVQREFLA